MLSTRNICCLILFISIINYTKAKRCKDIPKLIAPGLGWDALTNEDRNRTLKWTFEKCQLSNDEKYLIPDNIVAVRLNEIELTGQLFEHWSNYTPPNAAGFRVSTKVWPKQFLPLFYSFSNDYQKMKNIQVKNETFTVRSQLRQLVYRVHVTTDAKITDNLYDKFIEVMTSIVSKNITKAKNIIEIIVRDYGTHYTKSIDVGAIFLKQDYLKISFLEKHQNDRAKIVAASKLSLLDITDFPKEIRGKFDSSLVSEYDEAIVSKKIKFLGAINWENGIRVENMDIVAKSGSELSNLLTTSNFVSASSIMLTKVKQMLDETIQDYYRRNIHRGCTNPRSNNFDYISNIDDGSCKPVATKFFFGGFFQRCKYQSNSVYYGPTGCSSHLTVNTLTGGYNCPQGFTDYPIHSFFMSYYMTAAAVSGIGTRYFYDYVNVTAYICTSNSTLGESYLFGGLYSDHVDNIHTKGKTCPKSYSPITTLHNTLSVCVNTTNDESAKRYALPFGGLAGVYDEFVCKTDHQRHLAVKFDNVNIYYCLLKSEVKNLNVVPSLIKPPFENDSKCNEV